MEVFRNRLSEQALTQSLFLGLVFLMVTRWLPADLQLQVSSSSRYRVGRGRTWRVS